MSNIIDIGVLRGNVHYILEIGGYMLLVTVAGAACSVLASYISSRVSSSFGKTLRRTLFTHIEHFTLREFDEIGTSSLITRTTNDITQVQQLVNMTLRLMVMAPMMAIGGIVMAVLTDTQLSLVIVVVTPVLGICIYLVMHRAMALFRAMQTKIDALGRVLRENLVGVRVVRSFNRVAYEQERFNHANRDLIDTAIRVNQIIAALWPLMMLIINLATLVILWFGGVRVNNLHMQIGNLMAFIQYVMQIMFSVMMVSMMFFMVPRASASAERINQVLDMDPEIRDPAVPMQLVSGLGGVEFRAVTFRYPGAEQAALSDVSFVTRPGEVTAIIGGTGSGKSTLVNLLMRFYDLVEGSILINGLDIRAMSQANLRAKVGFVPQKPVLFTGSVAANIRFGKEDATDEEVRHAADVAQAMEFIADMDEGLDASISQGGGNVSGGQKQRLAIARALVRQPEIYVFDDSFSALDFKTDANLRAALRTEVVDATVLIVAQRVSTVMDADCIVVLDEGCIAGIGRHADLLESCEVYREIVLSQLSEEEIA